MSLSVPENNNLQELDCRQDRLLDELDSLNQRIEQLIGSLSSDDN